MIDPDTHQTAQPAFGAAIALMVFYMVVLSAIAVGGSAATWTDVPAGPKA